MFMDIKYKSKYVFVLIISFTIILLIVELLIFRIDTFFIDILCTFLQDLKDAFLEYQKRTNPYAPNPFERRKSMHTVKSNAEKRYTGEFCVMEILHINIL